MNSHTWLSSTSPADMLAAIADRVSERKLRLIAVACCRAVWERLTDERSRQAVEVAERFADGLTTDAERNRAWDTAIFEVGGLVFAAARCADDDEHIHLSPGIVSDAVKDWLPLAAQADIIRDVVGNPFEPADLLEPEPPETRCGKCGCTHCNHETGGCCCADCGADDWITPVAATPWHRNSNAVSIATAIYQDRDWEAMPILSDALEDAGCDYQAILNHCRGLIPCPRTETVLASDTCPNCGNPGRWRRGVGFEGEKLCMKCEPGYASWEPGKQTEIRCKRCGGQGWRKRSAPHARGDWVLDLLLGKS